jgi:hypothetical protein
MTAPRPLQQRVERMRRDLARIEAAIGPACTVARAMMADGYGSGGGDGRGSDIYASSTAAAALARWDDFYDRVIRRVKVINVGLEDLADELVRMQKKGPDHQRTIEDHKTAKDRARCSGGVGIDGYFDWGDPSCENTVGQHSTTGICDKCRMAKRRWEIRAEKERAS